MAHYYINGDGSVTKKKKESSGNHYIVNNDGSISLLQNNNQQEDTQRARENYEQRQSQLRQAKKEYDEKINKLENATSELNTIRSSKLKQSGAKSVQELLEEERNKQLPSYNYVKQGNPISLPARLNKSISENNLKYAQVNNSKEVLKEREKVNKIANDLVLARYNYNVEDVSNRKMSTMEKILGALPRAISDLGSAFSTDNVYTDENGKKIHLPTRDALLQQKASEESSFLGKLAIDTIYNGTKILASEGLNLVSGGIGGSALYFNDMFSDSYKNAYNKTGDTGKAFANGLAQTGLEFVTEKLLGGVSKSLTGGKASALENAISDKLYAKLGNKTLSNIAGSMGSEFTEEFVQEFAGNTIDLLTLGSESGYKNIKDAVFNSEVLAAALYSGMVGGLSGGAIAGFNTKTGLDKSSQKIQMVEEFKTQLEESRKTATDKTTIKTLDTAIENANKYLERPFTNLDNEQANEALNRDINNFSNNILPMQQNINANPLQNLQQFNQNQQEIRNQQIQEETNKRTTNIENEMNILLPTASTEGMNLQESAARYNIDPQKQIATQTMMENRGIEARWDGTRTEFKDGTINAIWSKDENGNRSVIFNPNASENAIIENIAIHELTHDIMSSQNSGEKLKANEIIDYVKTLDGYAEARQNLVETYSKQYNPDSKNFNSLIDEEVVADVLGRKLGNQEFINRLNNQKPKLARNIYNWVAEKLNSIVNRGGKVRSERLYWENVKNRFETAFNMEYNNSTNGTDTRFSKDSGIARKFNSIQEAIDNNPKKAEYAKYNTSLDFFNLDYAEMKKAIAIGSKYALEAQQLGFDNYSFNDEKYIYDIDIINKENNTFGITNMYEISPEKEAIINESINKQDSGKIDESSKYVKANDTEYSESITNRTTNEENVGLSGNKQKQFSTNENRQSIKSENNNNQRELDNSSFSYDSQGRTLSKQQQKYFKDSKVRDEKGNLEIVYHGTPSDFTIFDISKSNNVALGNGLYFTNVESTADAYANNSETSGKILEGYLDIKKPINSESKTISYDEFKNIYEALDKNSRLYDEEMGMSEIKTLLSDYGDIYNENIDNILKKYYNAYDNDVSLIDNLSYMRNAKELYETIRKATGTDGIIIEHPSDFAPYEKYYIAFNSNQFKNVDNTNPTTNDDIRYSKENKKWNKWVNDNFKQEGTTTKLRDVKLPTKQKTINVPTNQETKKTTTKQETTIPTYKDFANEKVEQKVNRQGLEAIRKATNAGKSYLQLKQSEVKTLRNELKEYLGLSKEQLTNAKTYNGIKDKIEQFMNKQVEYLDEDLKRVKKEVRNTKIKVNSNIKEQITDYGDFRKQNFGKLRLTTEGRSIDSVYKELSELYPYYFDSSITSEADMLYELSDFMDKPNTITEEYKLSDSDMKKATDKIFNSLIDNSLSNEDIETMQNDILEKYSKRTRKVVQLELLNDMGITLDDISVGKDISSLDLQRTDPIRVNEKVFGAKVGQKINDETINKTKHNEAERTRFLNKERDDIKELGIKPRSKESAAVQKYGEKQYINSLGELVKYGDVELASEFSNVKTQEKIKHAAEVLRNKYDKYIEQINSVITELGYDPIPKRPDYMRHFQEVSDKLSQWGIPLNPTDLNKENIPTDINGLTDQFRPGKNWFASAMARKGLKTTYDAITGIDGYLEGASNLIYHTEDIQRYRTLSKFIRGTYGQTHGMDNVDIDTKEGQQRLNDIFDNKLSKYVAWLDEQANSLAGKKGGIDRAAERLLGRKVYTVLDTAKKQVGSNMTGFNVRSALTNFASAVQGASKTNKLAFVKGTLSTLKNIVHNDGMINKSDFLTNRFGSDQLSKKAWQKASNAGQILMTGSDYFTANQIWRSKYYENLSKKMSESQAIKNADDFAARIMGDRSKGSTAEIFNSKTLGLLTQFQLEVNNQWSSIMHDNKMDIQRGNKSGATVVFQLGQLAAMSYFFNNFMKSLTGSDVMIDPIDMFKKILGDDDDDEDKTLEQRTIEVFGDLIDDLPFASFLTGGRIPMAEAFTGVETAFKKLTNQKDKFGNEIKWSDVGKDTISSGAYWLLPTGYGQIRKTTKGLSMYDKKLPVPGSYTESGNLRFDADESTGGKVKAALFGQYSSKQAQDYINSGYKTIRKQNLHEMKDLGMNASEYRKYREALTSAGKKDIQKINYVDDSNYTEKQKNIMYKNILDLKEQESKVVNSMSLKDQNKYLTTRSQANSINSSKDIESSDKKQRISNLIIDTNLSDKDMAYLYSKYYSSEDKMNMILDMNIPIKEYIKADTKEVKGSYYVKTGKTVSGSKKKEYAKYVNTLNLSVAQKAILIKMKYNSFKTYDNKIVNYINNINTSANEKKVMLKSIGFKNFDKDVINYINSQHISKAEKEKKLKGLGFTIRNGRVYY